MEYFNWLENEAQKEREEEKMEKEKRFTPSSSLTKIKVPDNVTISCEERLKECQEFLDTIDPMLSKKLQMTLNQGLEIISKFGPATLYSDFAPLSFTWSGKNISGGLIFHGSHDGFGSGGSPTFSVSLTQVHGWSIHT
jgi:hypothetical protein